MRWKETEYSGWGRVLKASGRLARPERRAALKAVLKEGAVPAIGRLRSYGDAALNDGGGALDMGRLDRLISFDETTGDLEAEAGVTIGEIARIFAPRGWLPAVMPGTGFATLGGCIANDVHGKNHRAGSFGQHVREIALIGASGRLRRITPDSAPDLFRATIGGLGQTGVIQSAVIRMVPVTSTVMEVRESRIDSLGEFLALLEGSNAEYCVGWIDATARGAALGRGILEEAAVSDHASPLPARRARAIPFDAPSFLLSSPVVRLFNRLYLRRVPPEGRQVERVMQDFFFPLDRIHDWNRLYGKAGFHQFQCVLPEGAAEPALRQMLERVSESGLASPLAVLKRMGPGRGGMMSFPMEGFTLALDFPNRARASALIRDLEVLALEAGGRIYLAKDSLAEPETIAAMYDEREAWAKIVNAADPEARFQTDLVRRLRLREGGQ